MKICPACSEDVKDDAKKCPHCHFLIAPDSDVFAKPAPAKTVTLTLDNTLIRVGGIAAALFAMFVVVGVALYGLDLRNARNELHNIQLMNSKIQTAKEKLDSDIKNMLADFKTRAAEIETLRTSIDGQLKDATQKIGKVSDDVKQVSDQFERRLGGQLEGNGVADLDTLDSALEQSKTNRTRLDSVEKDIANIKRRFVQLTRNRPDEQTDTLRALGIRQLTAGEMTRIKESIKIRQTSRSTGAPRGREAEGRNWHELTFSVFVHSGGNDDGSVLRLIEKVIYHFNKDWWKDPSKVVINRRNNFSYSVRVWGRTSVDVEVFVKGFDAPLTAKLTMILEDDSVKDFGLE